jgi:hypothetical protein
MRRRNDEFGAGIDVIYGVTRDGTSEVQAIRFDADRFTPAQARAWLEEHDYTDIIEFEEATEAALAFAYDLVGSTPAAVLSESQNPDGVKRARFKKEIVRVGSYVHPTTGDAFDITPAMLKNFVKQFHQMQVNGVTVPFQRGHDIEDDTAKDALGTVYDMDENGKSCFGYIEVIGAGAIEETLRNDVSIYSPPEWIDGKGNVYRAPVVHVALHPYPVLPDLGGWQTIAASLASKKDDAPQKKERRQGTEETMDLKALQKLAKTLGIEDELTEDNAAEKIGAAVKALSKKVGDLEKKAEKATKALELAQTQKDEAEKDAEIPEAVLELAVDARATKIEALVEAGKLKPACAEKIAQRFGEGDSLKLSLGAGREDFKFWLGIIGENETRDMKEKTGPQVLALHGAGSPDALKDNPLIQSAERMAGRQGS